MANIEVKGYCNRPQAKESSRGGYSRFTLAERQKQKDGTFTKAYYQVTDFNSATPPDDGAFVTVKGYLKMRDYDAKDGTKKVSLDVVCQELTVSPPLPGRGGSSGGPAPAEGNAPDPWEV
jgi:hypothetical protein